MKFFLALLGVTALVCGGGYFYVQAHPEVVPTAWHPQFDHLQQQVQGVAEQAKDRWDATIHPATSPPQSHGTTPPHPAPSKSLSAPKHSTSTSPKSKSAAAPALLKNPTTLYLKNGGVVTGEFVSETPKDVTLRWEYGDVTFAHAEIQRLVKGKHDTADNNVTMPWENEHQKVHWSYHHDVVVKLTKGTVIDAEITTVTPQSLVLTQTVSGGGAVEQTIPRSEVEQLMFRPIKNERSTQIEEKLRALFPQMQWYEEGMFTIVTDSIPPVVKEYRRTIRELATDWYLAFLPLAKSRRPMVQQYLVVFENWDSYIEYAATDGVPGWIAVGYFHPEHEVLYCFNMLGERFSELLQDVYLGQFRKARDQVSAQIHGARQEEFIEGQMSEFLQKLETAHAMVRQVFGQLSIDVLRHELTHAMFHNWRLQGIILSQMAAQSKEELEKKRQYLKTDNVEEKRKLLDELLAQKTKTALPEMQASNSWFVEGLATYMEPSPIGGINHERLAEVQEARTQQQILPLEFLHAFRMGSFSGMATQSVLYAYAQSWALSHFLMHRYPQGFLAYLERLAHEQPKKDEDTLPWLMQALGKEQRPLEQEFMAYLDQFPHEDPVWLKQMQAFLDLRSELSATAQRLWSH